MGRPAERAWDLRFRNQLSKDMAVKSVFNRKLDDGTTFTFTLPLASDSESIKELSRA